MSTLNKSPLMYFFLNSTLIFWRVATQMNTVRPLQEKAEKIMAMSLISQHITTKSLYLVSMNLDNDNDKYNDKYNENDNQCCCCFVWYCSLKHLLHLAVIVCYVRTK